VGVDQLQQEVDGTLEDGQRDGGSHDPRRYRLALPSSRTPSVFSVLADGPYDDFPCPGFFPVSNRAANCI
jgi:hypothetical protein